MGEDIFTNSLLQGVFYAPSGLLFLVCVRNKYNRTVNI